MPPPRSPFTRPTPTPARPPVSKIGAVSLDRNVAQAPAPSDTPATQDGRTLISTFFTSLPNVGDATQIIYNGDRLWGRITLTLESAGPVSIGTMSNLDPVLGGNGTLLTTNVPVVYDIYKGTRLYVLATGVNRIKVVVAPIPWLEMITGLVARIASGVMAVARPASAPAAPAPAIGSAVRQPPRSKL